MTKEDKRRKELIKEAQELDQEISFLEDRLLDIVSEIEILKPTKKELKEGVQDLINFYG